MTSKQSYRDLVEATQESPPDRETMIAELGRRHPAAADDVDAILAMPRPDAVNEGLLALADQIEREGVTVHGVWHPAETVKQMIVAALRAVPSPGTVGVREVVALALFSAAAPWRTDNREKFIKAQLPDAGNVVGGGVIREVSDALKNADIALAALSHTHCTSARREDGTEARIAVLEKAIRSIANNTCCDNCREAALVARSALASYIGLARTSEQSGPTAGEIDNGCYTDDPRLATPIRTPAPPDRQQDQDETSVLPPKESK